jgi:hypothetical protein
MKCLASFIVIACMAIAVSKFSPAGPGTDVGSASSAGACAEKSGPVNSVGRRWTNCGSQRNPSPSPPARNDKFSPNLVSVRTSAPQHANEVRGAPPLDMKLGHATRTITTAPNSRETNITLPVTFMLPGYVDASEQAETDLVHNAQTRFADTMNAEAGASGPSTPEYARQWQLAKTSHDDMLRLQLGHEGFFRLSARALQQAESLKAASVAGRQSQ